MKTPAEIIAARFDGILKTALGPDIARFLAEPDTTDLLLNADGRLWIDSIGAGRRDTGCTMDPDDADRALRYIAHSCLGSQDIKSPLINATLPTGERLAATIPPITSAPTFAIRKPAASVFPLDAFGTVASSECGSDAGDIAPAALTKRNAVIQAVASRQNVLIAGGMGSGKTSFLSSLMQMPEVMADRCVVLEDRPEVQISAPDQVRFVTTAENGLRQLVEHAQRYRPDRLTIGEVRSGDAAVPMLNALNSGHPGSFCTIHADSARRALRKLEILCMQGCGDRQSEAITEAFGLVVFMRKNPNTRRREIAEVIHVHDYDNGKFIARDTA